MTKRGVEPLRRVEDAERRARLGRRHGLAPGARFGTMTGAARALTGLHATEPATVHLGLRARVDGIGVDDVERALYDERSIVKLTAMRGTLFAFPHELLGAAWGSVSARLARSLRARLIKDVVASGATEDGDAWLTEASDAVVHALTGREASTVEVRDLVPMVDARFTRGAGRWIAETPVAPQLLWLLTAEGRVLRAHNGGHWRLSKPRWTATASWLPELAGPLGEREGYATLVGQWLRAFGPGTEADLRWWLGSTLGAVRTALADVGAVPVTVTGSDGEDEIGWLLADDLDVVPSPETWVALLPTLDSTVMGWRGRGFYLGPHREMTFDSSGNAGTTAWWDGRIVGCWVQEPDGAVRVHPLEELPAAVRRALDGEAARLTAWLDGVVVTSVYASAAMVAARG